jgi:acyl-CoA synthetase (AMP-forming)/AMP-acid ligase II
VVAFGVFNPDSGTEDVVVLVESDENGPEKRQAIAEQIRLRVTRGSDVALRNVQVVERGWLLKTSSGKIARSANREKYLHDSADPAPARSLQAGL